MARVIWSDRGRADLRAALNDIAVMSGKRTAAVWAGKIYRAVSVLRRFPEIGARVEEIEEKLYREQIVGPYRIIYHFDGKQCKVLCVVRAERDLRNIPVFDV